MEPGSAIGPLARLAASAAKHYHQMGRENAIGLDYHVLSHVRELPAIWSRPDRFRAPDDDSPIVRIPKPPPSNWKQIQEANPEWSARVPSDLRTILDDGQRCEDRLRKLYPRVEGRWQRRFVAELRTSVPLEEGQEHDMYIMAETEPGRRATTGRFDPFALFLSGVRDLRAWRESNQPSWAGARFVRVGKVLRPDVTWAADRAYAFANIDLDDAETRALIERRAELLQLSAELRALLVRDYPPLTHFYGSA